MVSVVLVLVARESPHFLASYKMLNVTEGKTQLPRNIIEHSNLGKFRYNDYLAIFRFKLLSYVVGVDAWLGEHCGFFSFKVSGFRRSATIHWPDWLSPNACLIPTRSKRLNPKATNKREAVKVLLSSALWPPCVYPPSPTLLRPWGDAFLPDNPAICPQGILSVVRWALRRLIRRWYDRHDYTSHQRPAC